MSCCYADAYSFKPAVVRELPTSTNFSGAWKKFKINPVSVGGRVRPPKKIAPLPQVCADQDRDRALYCDLTAELRSVLTWNRYKKQRPQPLLEPGPSLERPSFAIISAYVPTVTPAENKRRHVTLMKELRTISRLRVREVKGRWQGQDELSILVVNITKFDAIQVATRYEQDAYLFRAAGSPHAEIIDARTGAKTNFGRWTEITHEQAIQERGFTFDPASGRCYVIQPVPATARLQSKGWEEVLCAHRYHAFRDSAKKREDLYKEFDRLQRSTSIDGNSEEISSVRSSKAVSECGGSPRSRVRKESIKACPSIQYILKE